MSNVSEPASELTACIFTLDTIAVTVLREYLSQYGYDISVNSSGADSAAYEIIVGDLQFVKSILVNRPHITAKRLIIIWTSQLLKFSDLGSVDGKIIQMKPRALTTAETKEALHYLFTSRQRTMAWIDTSPSVVPVSSTLLGNDSASVVGRRADPGSAVQQEPTTTPTQPAPATRTPPAAPSPGLPKTRPVVKREYAGREFSDRLRISRTIESVYRPVLQPSIGKIPARWKTVAVAALLPIVLVLPYLIAPVLPAIPALRILSCYRKRDFACMARQSASLTSSAQTALSIVSAYRTFTYAIAPAYHDDSVALLQWFSSLGELGRDSAAAVDLLMQLSVSLVSFGTSNDGVSPIVAVDKLKGSVDTIGLRLAQASLSTDALITGNGYPMRVSAAAGAVSDIRRMLTEARQGLTAVDQAIAVFPKIGGFREPKRYLVLLQNDAELRPTGGFIGSYMKLTVDTGRIGERTIEDVYTADGQMKGHVDPPDPIRQLLGQEHWYFRDSNWNPDFRESGARALWFYQKETGGQADGVVAVNSGIVRDILAAIGPVEIGDNDRITADNFNDKALAYTEKDFFPGSTQKKDFLGMLTEALLRKADDGGGEVEQKVVQVLLRALLNGDILVYFADPEIQRLAEQFGWSGAVPELTDCAEKSSAAFGCRILYSYVNEANVGMTKTSRSVGRQTSRTITVSEDGSVSETISQTLTATRSGGEGETGYTAYLRFILPPDIVGLEMNLDGSPLGERAAATTSATLPYWEFDRSLPQTTTVGVALTIPTGGHRTVTASYRLSTPLVFGKTGTLLEIINQKQPGVESASSTTGFSYPADWHVSSMQLSRSPASLANPGRLEYNTDLSADDHIYLSIRKTL
jgi:hypothetical protein